MILQAGACTIALVALGAGVAQAQQVFNIDHYLVYNVGPPLLSDLQVDLLDQFGPSSGILMEREFFANPVDKTHPPELPNPENLLNPYEHLSWWRLNAPPEEHGYIFAGNQFAPKQTWQLGPAEYLLVPAIKDQIGDITWNQHYQCYVAHEAPDIQIDVTLGDQFGMRPAVVGRGRYFCNPVEKIGPLPLVPSGPPIFPEDHLACYDIDPWPADEIRFVQDQVDMAGGQLAQLTESLMLCVPSTKRLYDPSVPVMGTGGMVTFGALLLLMTFWLARRRLRGTEPA
jgi:hypothetical protein